MVEPVMAEKQKKEEEKWRAEDDLRTLQRAEEIRKDPERMKKAMKVAEEQMNALKHTLATKPVTKIT